MRSQRSRVHFQYTDYIKYNGISVSASVSPNSGQLAEARPPAPSLSVWLMKSDLSYSRNLSANFIHVCLGHWEIFLVAYGNVLPPIIVHLVAWYHPPPLPLIPLWSASKWHSCLAAFITALRWMSRPHLHNTAGISGVQMEGKLQELCMRTISLFLTQTRRRPQIEVCKHLFFFCW